MNKLSWKDITVDQYISIMRILKDDTLGDKDKMYEICQICYFKDIRQLPINDALECAENINTLLSQEIKTSSVKNIKHITFANKKFKVTQAEDITFGQFTDFQTLISQGYDKIAELLSILLVPSGAKYNDGSYSLKEIVDDIRKLDVSTAYSLINFFLNTLKRRSITTLCSLMWFTIWMKESWKVKKELLKQQMIALYSLYKVSGC